MKKYFCLFVFVFGFYSSAKATDCDLYYFRKGQFENSSIPTEFREASAATNAGLKKAYEYLVKLDHATLGLVSAYLPVADERMKPENWDKFQIIGQVAFQDSAFSTTTLKGAKVTFTESKNTRTITTGAFGEFVEYFSKIVPYKRIRLFPVLTFESGTRKVPTIKVPIQVKVESKICTGQTTLHELTIDPIMFVLMPKEVR